MTLYHVTSIENAGSIRLSGFRDGARDGLAGVWLSDAPLWDGGYVDDAPEGMEIIAAEVLDDVAAEYEVTCPAGGCPYREWCIPARLLKL